jgi:hypothetical protein
LRFAVAPVTNRPELALRATARPLLVPEPTRSVVVLPGHRTTVARETNRPVLALRDTLLPAMTSSKDSKLNRNTIPVGHQLTPVPDLRLSGRGGSWWSA